MPEPAVAEQDLWRDLRPVLDEELSRLPDKYRAVIVLCDLEGKTRKEVARQLSVPEGTVASRMATARRMLAKRLARHGLAVSGGALAALLTENVASAGAPASASVVTSTIKAVTLVAAGQAAVTGVISVKVAALTEGVMKSMLLTKLKIATAGLLVMAFTFACGAGVIYQTQAAEQPKVQQVGVKTDQWKHPATEKDEKPKPDKERLQGTWQIVSTVVDGNKEKVIGNWTIKDMTLRIMCQPKDDVELKTFHRFRLNETTNPKRIDMVEGKADDLFDTTLFDKRFDDADKRRDGIYSIAGKTLKICVSRTKGKRPTAIESKSGSDYILIVLKREPKD